MNSIFTKFIRNFIFNHLLKDRLHFEYLACCDSLESLEYVPPDVGDFRCVDCPKVTSLEGLKKVIGELVAVGCGKTFTNKYLEKLNIE